MAFLSPRNGSFLTIFSMLRVEVPLPSGKSLEAVMVP